MNGDVQMTRHENVAGVYTVPRVATTHATKPCGKTSQFSKPLSRARQIVRRSGNRNSASKLGRRAKSAQFLPLALRAPGPVLPPAVMLLLTHPSLTTRL
jgi:hypothetical protein